MTATAPTSHQSRLIASRCTEARSGGVIGSAAQYQGLAKLNAHSMHATYSLNSPKISGDSEYMTWAQVAGLAAAGNEIAGHTAYHVDLPFIDPAEAQREICYDRDNLLQRG